MVRMTSGLSMLAVCAGSAIAGPLVPSRVLPDATWVVHLDIEGMVNSNIGRQLLSGEFGEELRADIEEDFVREMGIDPLRDLRGVTIFGHTDEETEALILISANNGIDAPLAKLPDLVPNYNAIREGDRVVHTWRDNEETVYAYAAPGAGGNGERVVLFSGNIDELRRGMLRLEAGGAETAPALSDGKAPSPGSFFFVSADRIPGMGDADDGASAMLRYARQIVFDAGEQGNEFRASARITTDDAADATTMLQAVQGMMAMGRMIASSEPEMAPLVKLADGCRASADGSALVLTIALDTNLISNFMREMEAFERQAEAQPAAGEDQQLHDDLKKLEKLEKVEKHQKTKKAE